MRFLQEHGEYVAGCSQQTIMFAARGPWNDATWVNGSKEMGQNIRQFNLSEPLEGGLYQSAITLTHSAKFFILIGITL